jgi:hypothetical protein
MTTTDKPATDKAAATTAEAQLAKSNALKAESVDAMKEREKWMPTPTQEENDLAATGQHPAKKPDGSPVEKAPEQHTRSMEAGKKPGAEYSTRAAG